VSAKIFPASAASFPWFGQPCRCPLGEAAHKNPKIADQRNQSGRFEPVQRIVAANGFSITME